MKNIFKKIWKLALPYQDKRTDKGHAAITLKFALELLKKEKACPEIVIPAIILHDTGYSQLSKHERFLPFILKVRMESAEDKKAKTKHQVKSVQLARKILKKINYDAELTREILKIISQHDTGRRFLSREDGLVKDADRLWRFSRTGFLADLRRLEMSHQKGYERLKDALIDKRFFFSKTAKKIAKERLKKLK